MTGPQRLVVLTAVVLACCCHPSIEQTHDDECSLWFAPSTIPGAGMGVFAGTNFSWKQEIMEKGDVVIPIVDIFAHQEGRMDHFLLNEYSWHAIPLLMENEGLEVIGMSPGLGSALNCILDLVNVKEYPPTQINGSVGLHRSRDPGAGAFSYYHNRRSIATTDITAGQELFVDYGVAWFESREQELGALPLAKNYELAGSTRIVQNFRRLLDTLWEYLVPSTSTNQSRRVNAISNDPEELSRVKEASTRKYRREQATVSMDYLRENGMCVSNLLVGESRIPQAGRGAFAGRAFQEGDVVAPMPLIHLVDGRLQMEMYQVEKHKTENFFALRNRTNLVGHQLMMNYCFGHPESTVFLCPYGLRTSFVNHDFNNYNVKIRWGDEQRTSHNFAWLKQSLKKLRMQKSAVLAFELVATRPIKEGEEVLLNYGAEWEEAWRTHVQNWQAQENSTNYKSSREYNEDKKSPLKTAFDELEDKYPENVKLKCHSIFLDSKVWKRLVARGQDLDSYIAKSEENKYVSCDITARYQSEDKSHYLYTAVSQEDEAKDPIRMADLPREAFVFIDEVFTTDLYLKNAFRHEAIIPDEMIPNHWRNLKRKG